MDIHWDVFVIFLSVLIYVVGSQIVKMEEEDTEQRIINIPYDSEPSPYMTNVISTAKYTVYNFLPKNLYV